MPGIIFGIHFRDPGIGEGHIQGIFLHESRRDSQAPLRTLVEVIMFDPD